MSEVPCLPVGVRTHHVVGHSTLSDGTKYVGRRLGVEGGVVMGFSLKLRFPPGPD